jgi:hypothetical protein
MFSLQRAITLTICSALFMAPFALHAQDATPPSTRSASEQIDDNASSNGYPSGSSVEFYTRLIQQSRLAQQQARQNEQDRLRNMFEQTEPVNGQSIAEESRRKEQERVQRALSALVESSN